MAYIDKATMQDACNADTGDAPGMNADCKFIAPGEDISTEVANRPHLQLAENSDVLKAFLDAAKAVTQTATLSSFSGGASLTIDPTNGGGSDINYLGTLYLGTGYTDNQESRDTLFQFLDAEYNEVTVGGEEVKVTAVAGGTIGSGFYNSGIVTLTLDPAPPTGDYRLRYAVGSSLALLPDDALINADIRGVHEAPGEATRPSWIVCAPAGEFGDYTGSDALANAITDIGSGGNKTIFLRSGTYEVSGSVTIRSGVTIVGESGRDATGAVIQFTGVGTITMQSYSHLQNLRIEAATPTGSEEVLISSAIRSSIRDVNLDGVNLRVSGGNHCDIKNLRIDPYDVALTVQGPSQQCSFENILVTDPTTPPTAIISLAGIQYCSFKNIRVNAGSTDGARGVEVVSSDALRCSFSNLNINIGDNASAIYLATNFEECTVTDAYFESKRTVLYTDAARRRGITFKRCYFANTATAWHVGKVAEVHAWTPGGEQTLRHPACVMEDCRFYDAYSQGHTSPNDPSVGGGAGTPYPILELEGVVGRNIYFTRPGNTIWNVEDSPWVQLTNCIIDGFTVEKAVSASFTPMSYGAFSKGFVEVLGESRIRNLHVAVPGYDGAVNRSLVYAQNANNLHSTDYDDQCLPAEVDGLQLSFTGDSVTTEVDEDEITYGLALTLDGNAHVKNFVMNDGCTYAREDDAGAGPNDPSTTLVFIRGKYNVLENPMMDVKGSNGSAISIITVGTNVVPGDRDKPHGNRILGGKISMTQEVVIDPASKYFPWRAVHARYGTGLHIDGLIIRSAAPQDINWRAIYVYGHHYSTIVNCQVHTGDLVTMDEVIRFESGADNCVLVGNVFRALAGATTPIIGGTTPTAAAANVLDVDTTPTEPAE